MAGKFSASAAKAVACVFTAVVAPVVVHTVTKDDKAMSAAPTVEKAADAPKPPPPESRPAVVRVPSLTPAPLEDSQPEPPVRATVVTSTRPVEDVTQVVVTGVGKSADEALRDALNKALYRTAAAQVAAATWAAHEQALWAGLGADGGDLIRGWRDLGTRMEWAIRGTTHHRELAVDVDRGTVTARLRAVLDRPVPDGWR